MLETEGLSALTSGTTGAMVAVGFAILAMFMAVHICYFCCALPGLMLESMHEVGC